MSVERNPNINAAGLTVDVLVGILEHIRGKAGEASPGTIINLLRDDVTDFIIKISDRLDETYPVVH